MPQGVRFIPIPYWCAASITPANPLQITIAGAVREFAPDIFKALARILITSAL